MKNKIVTNTVEVNKLAKQEIKKKLLIFSLFILNKEPNNGYKEFEINSDILFGKLITVKIA